MARTSPQAPNDSITLDQLFAGLNQMGINPSNEDRARLLGLGGGYLIPIVTGVNISAPNLPSVNLPIVISSDEEEDGGTESSEEGFPTTASVLSVNLTDEESLATTDIRATPGISTNDAASGNEEEAPKPGTYLECQVCGTLFDLTQRKSRQPWHIVFVGRTVRVFRHFWEAAQQVNGVSKGFRRRFKTRAAAEQAFQNAQEADKVRIRLSNKEMHAANDAAQKWGPA